METRRWTNPSQPQTLQIAVFLFYAKAVISVLTGAIASMLGIGFIVGWAAAGFGIANEKRWAYALGLVMAFSPFVLRLAFGVGLLGGDFIQLMFEIALVALLLHPQSRDYQRIWFS
jgi:hypothetical protein